MIKRSLVAALALLCVTATALWAKLNEGIAAMKTKGIDQELIAKWLQ